MSGLSPVASWYSPESYQREEAEEEEANIKIVYSSNKQRGRGEEMKAKKLKRLLSEMAESH